MTTFLYSLFSLFEWIVQTSFKASVLIGIIFIIQRLLRRRLSAKWQFALWFLLIIRLILPYEIESKISLFNLIPSKNVVLPESERSSEITATSEIQIQNIDLPITPAKSILTEPMNSQNFRFTAEQVLALIWLMGILGIGIHIYASNFELWRKVHPLPLSSNHTILNLLEQCKSEMKINRPILLIEMEGIRIPVLFGIFKPKILLPKHFITQMTQDQIKHIFLHELAHNKRNDVLVSFITTLLQILYWFNPIIWFAFYRMRIDRELACDEMTLTRIGAAQSQSYGRTIISLLENIAAEPRLPLAVGVVETRKNLKRRIAMIARFKKSPFAWSFLGIIILFALAAISMTEAQEKTKNQKDVLPINLSDSLKVAKNDVVEELLSTIIQEPRIESKQYKPEIIIKFIKRDTLEVDGKLINVDSLSQKLKEFTFGKNSMVVLKPEHDSIFDDWLNVQTQLQNITINRIRYVNTETGHEVTSKKYSFEVHGIQFYLRPTSLNGKYGYIDRKGKIVIEAKFDLAWPFEEGLAGAMIDNKWGFIDTTGNFVIEPQFDQITAFKDGLAVVKTDEKWGYIEPSGKYFMKAQFSSAYQFNEGYAAVQQNQKWGFISKSSMDRNIAINYKYDRAYGFHEGLAAVQIDNKWGFINTNGELVIDFKFDNVDRFTDGLALVQIDGKYGYIDQTGNFIIKPQFEDAASFSEGFAAVRINRKYGYIDKTGQIIIEPQYDHATEFMAGAALVTIFENPEFNIKGQGFEIDKAGNVIGRMKK